MNQPEQRATYPDLKGQVVLITGASRGIGAGIARAFAHAGAKLFLHYRTDTELAQKLADSLPTETHLLKADLADLKQLNHMFEEIKDTAGTLNCAINNAGWNRAHTKLKDIDEELYHRIADVNLKGTLFCCLREINLMAQGPGAIINIGSVHQDTSVLGHTVYAATKGAIHALTGQLALEVADRNIRVNNIVPGYIDIEKNVHHPGEDTGIPLKRYGLPQDVASLCLFLASQEASFITGTDLVIDGGVSRKLARLPMQNY